MGFTENILQNLSKEELKFIEKQCFSSKESQAKTLFDLMIKFGEDEEKILPRFKKSAPNAQIAVVRNQLSQQILDGLYQFHSKEYFFSEVNELIVQLQTFIKKSVFDVALKLWEKAFSIAEANESFLQQIELLEIKLNLYQTRALIDDDGKSKIKQGIELLMTKKQNHISFQFLLFDQMELLNQNFVLRSEEGQEKFKRIIHDELMQDESKAMSVRSCLDFWSIKGQFFSITNQFDQAAYSFEKVVAILNTNPIIKKQRNLIYLSICAQLATFGYILQNEELMLRAIQWINQTEKYNEIEKLAANTFIINSQMALCDLTKDKIGLRKTIEQAHQLLKTDFEKLKHDVSITLLVACVSGYAEFGEYDLALQMLREFDSFIHTNLRIDNKVILYFYELIAQIETGNEQMVNDTIQNFNRFLLRNEFKGEFEQIMIRFLKIVSSSSTKMKQEMQVLKEQLSLLPQKSLLNQNRVLYQILLNMIESKIAGKKFHEYLLVN